MSLIEAINNATKIQQISSNSSQRSKSNMATKWLTFAFASVMLLVLLSRTTPGAEASTVSVGKTSSLTRSQQQAGDYSQHLENLISDLLDDAGDRLKKSRLPIAHAPRFGRRSDPLMAPTFSISEPNERLQGRWSVLYDD